MASFTESEAVDHEPPWHAESTMLQSKRCSFKGDKVPLAMNPGTFEGTRGRRRHHESYCPWVFIGVTAPYVVQSTKGPLTYS